LTGGIELLTFFLVGPVLAIAIGYTALREKSQGFNSGRYGMLCVVSGAITFLLFVFDEVVERRCQNPAVFSATDRYPA
jgi:hypothetical protein